MDPKTPYIIWFKDGDGDGMGYNVAFLFSSRDNGGSGEAKALESVSIDAPGEADAPDIVKLSLDGTNPEKAVQLAYTRTPADAAVSSAVWSVVSARLQGALESTETPETVELSADGILTAKAIGTEILTVKLVADGKEDIKEITVTVVKRGDGDSAALESVSINTADIPLTLGDGGTNAYQLTYSKMPANAAVSSVKWELAQPSELVSLSESGLLTALKEGRGIYPSS
ncbi:MAG: hypothetical protein IJU50_04790 [Lachnospiraceae bacterium]|nr:hypothetical protein [Lachnospiraceae bacterium]